MLIAVSLSWVGVAVAVGERAAGLLDEQPDGGEVVGRHADGVDGDVEGALGDEAVLPEVAEAAGPAGVLARGRRAAGVRPRSSQPALSVTLTWASARRSTVETRHARPSANAPPPRAAHHRRPSAGAETTPTTTPSSTWSRAISVAHTGMPRT